MARRKKAPDGFHKEQIIKAAGNLFMEKGIKQTSMDDIVKSSGYGKATLYTYFKSKKEIVSTLALNSMNKLLEGIQNVTKEDTGIKEQYLNICRSIFQFQKDFPQYFATAISMINLDFESANEIEKEAFTVGEKINEEVKKILLRGIEQGELREDLELPQTIFSFWASITGIITMSENKRDYIGKIMMIDRENLLEYGFNLMFGALKKGK